MVIFLTSSPARVVGLEWERELESERDKEKGGKVMLKDVREKGKKPPRPPRPPTIILKLLKKT